jgi:hypothetical protein
MTIKQQGGVFGRNPSFNDVDVNTLDVAGQVTAGSLNVDAGTLFVDAVNNFVGIGTAAPGDRLTVNGNIYLGATSRTVYTGGSADLMLQTNTGNTLISRDNGSTEIARFTTTGMAFPSGNGIDFSATAGTGTSELFDDYEQGTFSPVVKGTTSNPSVTSGTAYGRYTKIGNRVFGNVYMRQVWSSAGSGTLYVDGFPYVMFENQFPGISFGLTDLVGTISNGYLTTVYGTSGCAAVLTGASGVTGSNKYITFTFQYVTGEN